MLILSAKPSIEQVMLCNIFDKAVAVMAVYGIPFMRRYHRAKLTVSNERLARDENAENAGDFGCFVGKLSLGPK
jgi:hypothetical protein